MVGPPLVQISGTAVNNADTHTATLAAAPTAGNMLVFGFMLRNANEGATGWSTPVNWALFSATEMEATSSWADVGDGQLWLFYKTSTGGDGTFTSTTVSGGTNKHVSLFIEYSGHDTASPWEGTTTIQTINVDDQVDGTVPFSAWIPSQNNSTVIGFEILGRSAPSGFTSSGQVFANSAFIEQGGGGTDIAMGFADQQQNGAAAASSTFEFPGADWPRAGWLHAIVGEDVATGNLTIAPMFILHKNMITNNC